MAKNKMKEVAKLLGLELDEEFRIKNSNFRYKLSKDGFMFWSDYNQDWFYISKLEQLLIGYCEIIKLPKPILDEKEKEYLSNVIKQFRNQVVSISKKLGDYGEFIDIEIKEAEYSDGIYLPYFKPNSMYKGMKLYKDYTLKELEL